MAALRMTSHVMQASLRIIYNYNKHAGIATHFKFEDSVFVPRWEKEIFSDRPGTYLASRTVGAGCLFRG